jgi:NTP pyrophosphatase (non-canonical NTP hydrolase)
LGKSIKEITDIIRKFSDERGWRNEEPNHLISSIFIEIGELAEHYQWKSSFDKNLSEEDKTTLGFEFVDVIFYLFRLADHSGIDIEEYFDKKLPKLTEKFPIGKKAKTAHDEYRKSGKNKLYE